MVSKRSLAQCWTPLGFPERSSCEEASGREQGFGEGEQGQAELVEPPARTPNRHLAPTMLLCSALLPAPAPLVLPGHVDPNLKWFFRTSGVSLTQRQPSAVTCLFHGGGAESPAPTGLAPSHTCPCCLPCRLPCRLPCHPRAALGGCLGCEQGWDTGQGFIIAAHSLGCPTVSEKTPLWVVSCAVPPGPLRQDAELVIDSNLKDKAGSSVWWDQPPLPDL